MRLRSSGTTGCGGHCPCSGVGLPGHWLTLPQYPLQYRKRTRCPQTTRAMKSSRVQRESSSSMRAQRSRGWETADCVATWVGAAGGARGTGSETTVGGSSRGCSAAEAFFVAVRRVGRGVVGFGGSGLISTGATAADASGAGCEAPVDASDDGFPAVACAGASGGVTACVVCSGVDPAALAASGVVTLGDADVAGAASAVEVDGSCRS